MYRGYQNNLKYCFYLFLLSGELSLSLRRLDDFFEDFFLKSESESESVLFILINEASESES